MAIKARFVGREKLLARLNQLAPDTEKEAAQAQMDAANELASAIAARAPMGYSGAYARSIRGGRIAEHPGQAVFSTSKDKNATGVFADYLWRWLEFGTGPRVQSSTGRRTGKMPAQPHIFPTFRAMRKRIRRKVAGAINKAVRKAKR